MMQTEDFVISIDIGASKIAGGIIDLRNMRLIDVHFSKIDRRGGIYVINQVYNIIKILKRNVDRIAAISIVVPGIVNYTKNTVIWAPNIEQWRNIDLTSFINENYAKEFKHKVSVVLVDDRVACALGEAYVGVAKGFKNIVALIIGSGVGAGIVIDGKPYIGSFNLTGAIGWCLLDKAVTRSTEKGYLEEEIGGIYLEKEIKEFCKKDPHQCKNILNLANGIIDNITAELIFKAYDEGDELAKNILASKASLLGIVIANIINILAPDVIVLNGSVGIEIGKRFTSLIKTIAYKIVNPYLQHHINIKISELGFKANLFGAAVFWALHHL
jgi:glucokinase